MHFKKSLTFTFRRLTSFVWNQRHELGKTAKSFLLAAHMSHRLNAQVARFSNPRFEDRVFSLRFGRTALLKVWPLFYGKNVTELTEMS
jgi:hypothetical protein